MRTLQRAGAGLLALTFAAGIAACGSADDKNAATAGTNGSFCGALVKFNAAVSSIDISEDTPKDEVIAQGKEVAPLFATVVKEAPDDLADTAAELNTSIQALTKGDAEAFNDDATYEKYTGLVGGAIDSCGFDTTDVTGVDYAYQGVPNTIDAGTVAFKFTNASEAEFHMMAIVKKKDGVNLSWEELLALPEDQGQDKTEFKGAIEAEPGKSSKGLAELDPGSYALICFISVGGKDDGPPHFTQGMVQEFSVT